MKRPDQVPAGTSSHQGRFSKVEISPRTLVLLVVCGAGLLLVAAWAGRNGPQLLASTYLTVVLFVLSLALGAQFLVLTHYVTRAGWSTAPRRLAEHVAASLPLVTLLLIPIGVALPYFFPWAAESHAQTPATDLSAKARYLTTSAFQLRAAVYLALWTLTGWWFRRRSLAEDADPQPHRMLRTRSMAAPALVVYALSLTFAAFDWIMSLDPHWYSTLFGVQFFAGAVTAALAALILGLTHGDSLGRRALDGGLAASLQHRHDLGKMLFGFVAFWAYIGFSQYLIIWYANLPEETGWFAQRLTPGWSWVTRTLVIGHFVLPFFFLLPQRVKKNLPSLRLAALWLLGLHALDLYWLVLPHATTQAGDGLWLLALMLPGVGSLWLAFVLWLAAGSCSVPKNDPRLAESLSYDSG